MSECPGSQPRIETVSPEYKCTLPPPHKTVFGVGRVLKRGRKQDATMNLIPCVKFENHSAVVCIFVLPMVQPAVFTKSSAVMCKVLYKQAVKLYRTYCLQ